MNKPEEAHKIFNDYKETSYLSQSLLRRLLEDCFECLKLRSPEGFNQLFGAYQRTLERDPEVRKLLKTVGGRYLGIPDGSSLNIMSMMENLFK